MPGHSKENTKRGSKRNSKGICYVTGKKPHMGGKITRRGISKKAGGIGYQFVKNVKRKFRPNLQSVRIVDENGSIKRVRVSVKALKAGKVQKYVKVKRTVAA